MAQAIKMTMACVLAAGVVLVAAAVTGQAKPDQPAAHAAGAAIRVGVYDSRAIAIAYAASEFNPVAAKMKELQEATAAADAARVKALKAWGEKRQRQLHRQGFARMPVTDLLQPVQDRLAALALELHIDVIAFEANYAGQGVEKVDITLDLVKLYKPSEQTLKWVKQSLAAEPVDLDEIDRARDQ